MAPTPEEKVLAQLERGFASYLEDIRAAIRQPSVSRTGEGLLAMAEWVRAYLVRLGAETRLVPGRVAPIVEGALLAPGARPTLLFYDLYDVQPASPEGWIRPPFAADLVPDERGGTLLVGRGAFNSKGPLVGFLAVLRAFREAGVPLPVGIRFLIEGEEEIGSPSLEPYLRANREALRTCDAAFIPYLGTTAQGETPIRLGFKGLILLELSVEGGDWGGPAVHDVHAMHSAWIASPGWELLQALASLQTRQGRLAMDGLDAYVSGPDADDQLLIREIASGFRPEAWLAELGATRFMHDGSVEDLLTHLMFDPTLNIDALFLGDARPGEEPATQMPRRATAHVDLRLVPRMDVESTLRLLRAHLDRRGFSHVNLNVKSAYPWSKASPREPVVRALVAACRRHGGTVEVFPLHAGAAPMHLFGEVLGIPFAFGGLGHGGRSHAPNEFISAEGVRDFFRSMASFLFAFAGSADPC
jgi:acetylornithine deacetylase/succinyl-diaminopimelate desuccinylase-like protein